MARRTIPGLPERLPPRGDADYASTRWRSFQVRLRPRPETGHTSQGRTVLATDPDGFIRDGAEHGLFVHQTRMLSRYRYLIDGQPLMPVAVSNVKQRSWLGYYIHSQPGLAIPGQEDSPGPDAAQQTLELRLSRYVAEGIHEDVDLTNFSQVSTTFCLELEIDADFADQDETLPDHARQQHGALTREWRRDEQGIWELVFDYRARHHFEHQADVGDASIHRGLRLRVLKSASPPRFEEGRLRFDVRLEPRGTWHACVALVPVLERLHMHPQVGCRAFHRRQNDLDRRRDLFMQGSTEFRTSESHTLSAVVIGALEQARRDLVSLRLFDLDHGDRAWTMAAGLPIYVALFGRDTLTACWQAALLSSDMMRGTLEELVRWQGTRVDDWRDEQPGRMLHEAHTGPLAMLGFDPRERYYGAATTSAFYPVVLSELWHWTGDKERVRRLIEPALKGLVWMDEYARFGPAGFYGYLSRSTQGLRNQGWKDSSDGIVYPDGRLVEPPIATCEEQAFSFAARQLLSEVLWWLGDRDLAKRMYRDADELRKRFNDAYWMEEEGFFALGLDADGHQIRSVASNPGHCLAAGIVDHAHARRTADRLMAPDLFTGWGVRTLSSSHPAFDPYSYHRGSVWPAEHGTFALGFMRYGLYRHLERLCRGQFEAATLFDFYRLPEVFSGHPRDEDHPFPAIYPRANWPQAWSSSAVVQQVQCLLGLYPYAPLDLLLVDPVLPAWLPEITVNNLHVGEATVSLRFFRVAGDRSDFEILDQKGKLHVVRQASPWSLTETPLERARDLLESLLPGR